MATRQRLRLSDGTELSFVTAGEAFKLAVPLLHGALISSRMFREVVPKLAQVIAPDLPGCGESAVCRWSRIPPSFRAILELSDRPAIGQRLIYLYECKS